MLTDRGLGKRSELNDLTGDAHLLLSQHLDDAESDRIAEGFEHAGQSFIAGRKLRELDVCLVFHSYIAIIRYSIRLSRGKLGANWGIRFIALTSSYGKHTPPALPVNGEVWGLKM